ncbi:MFS transporter [Amycolatopsis sp. CA-128772]|uniref:MFS transporter n=1 Tax=Amycolatopsis sp. CA-128772 TaxID=2073159 RepID=UPI001E41043E|nr:MFS transporter [Amycolatopsis sp. CA-128772]
MLVFTGASLAAGLAGHVGVLIAARVVRGVGSGLMVPQVRSVIHAEFDERERPKAMTWYAAAFPLGGLAGPLPGGALTEADLFGAGWRAIFLVNVPIGGLALEALTSRDGVRLLAWSGWSTRARTATRTTSRGPGAWPGRSSSSRR